MKKILIALLSVMMVLSSFGCTKKDPEPSVDPEPIETDVQKEFHELQKSWFIEDISSDYSDMRFSLEDPSALGIKDVEVTLGDIETEEDDTTYADRLAELKKYDVTQLTSDQQIAYKSMEFYFQLMQEFNDFENDYTFAFTPNSGINNNLQTIYTELDIRNEQDIKDIITLLNDSDRYITQGIDYTKEQASKGIIQPDSVIDQVIEGCQTFIANYDNNEVIKIINAKIDMINIAGADEYKSQVEKAVKEVLIPAYQKIIDYYQSLKGTGTYSGRLCEYGADGSDLYELIVRSKASTDASVEDLIDLMDTAIYESILGILDVMNEVELTEDYGFDDPYKILEHIKGKMTNDFPQYPDVEYTIDFLDPSITSPNVSAYYLIAPIDNLKKNVVKVNPAFSDADPNGMCITLAHEGYPGHLYQNTYYFTNHPDNEYRYVMSFLGYAEGWAQYVETYAYNYFLNNKKEVEYMQYNNIFSYCMYAYADLQIHYNGWSVDDLTDYFSQYFYESAARENAEAIYDTVIGDPGMFLPYSVGLYKMWKMYTDTKDTLGKKFDFKAYNKMILDAGECPLDVLEEQVAAFVEKNK
ncbi:MAG: DUF885 domain-containing protein [Erysipelotrichaceae bacterium]|nr:DUF885 domain-containing protein [Erysipelotrichaceae bacterium]